MVLLNENVLNDNQNVVQNDLVVSKSPKVPEGPIDLA